MIRVVVKTFDVLQLVAQRNGQGTTLPEVASTLSLNQATAANIIKTLVEIGYLEHIGRKKGYKLGPNAFKLTNNEAYGQDLVTAARDEMEALTAQLNESCILGILRNYKRYIIHVVNSSQEIQVQVRSERNIYETASGRLLLAYLSEKELEQFIKLNGLPEKTLWPEATTQRLLQKELEKIRREGIAITHLSLRHVRGFAVPVCNQHKPLAGLAVFLPDYRYTEDRKKEIIDALKKAAEVISKRLGGV